MPKELPQIFEIVFEECEKNGVPHARISYDGKPLGSVLNDNAYEEDGYRYHDCFHFIYLTHRGLSHVVDALLGNDTAKSQTMYEEVFSLTSFKMRHFPPCVKNDRPKKRFLTLMQDIAGISRVEPIPPLETIATIIGDFYKNFDLLYANRGGSLVCNRALKSVTYQPPIA